MKKLLTLLALLMMSSAIWAQCFITDTASFYRTRVKNPYAIAISKSGRLAVTSVKKTDSGTVGMVKYWKDVYDFAGGYFADDSLLLTSPKGVAFDTFNNLYVVQCERSDSNILVFDSALHLIAAFNNGSGSTSWYNPKHIAVDNNQTIYVSSENTMPGTQDGKIIRITNPLTSPTRLAILNNLDSVNGVVADSTFLYVTEAGKDLLSVYNAATLLKVDSALAQNPGAIATRKCKIVAATNNNNRLGFYNKLDLDDASIYMRVVTRDTQRTKTGIRLNSQNDVLICDNDNNRVQIYRDITPRPTYTLPAGPPPVVTWPLHMLGYMCRSSVKPLFEWGTWVSSDTSVVSIDSAGYLHAGHLPGSCTVSSSVGGHEIIVHVIVEAPISFYPSAIYANTDSGTVYGGTTTCYLNSIRLRDDYPGGEWFSSDIEVAEVGLGGSVWPKPVGGIVSIGYGLTNSCGFSGTSFTLNVTGKPEKGVITGDTAICYTGSTVLSETEPSGTWTVNDTTKATISAGGTLTAVAPGDVVITYTIDNGCDVSDTSFNVHIDTIANPGTIIADDTLCLGTAYTLQDTSSSGDGKWASLDTTIVSINSASGDATTVLSGNTTIRFNITNSCGTEQTDKNITVLALPHIGTFSGPNTICHGVSDSLHQEDSVGTLTWLTSNAGVADVSAYNVTGIGYGEATLTVRSVNYCGADSATWNVHVDSNISTPTLAGVDSICMNTPFSMSVTSGLTDGKWRSSDVSIASVDSLSGVITGHAEGFCEISYTVSAPCDTLTAYRSVYIMGAPQPAPLAGPDNVCPGATVVFTSPGYPGSGYWTSANTAIALAAGGVVTGVAAGTTNITFTTSNACGDTSITKEITVDSAANAGTIAGPSSVCKNASITLSVTGSTGTLSWASANPDVATVAGNTVGGAAAGATNIIVTATTSCGTASATYGITVNPLPNAGTLSGPTTACQYTSASYSATGVTGTITWSSADPGIISISPTGSAYFVAEGTTDLIATATTATCGTATNTLTVTVNPAPHAADISAPTAGCLGSVADVDAYGSTGDGYWYSSDPSILDFYYTMGETGSISYYSEGTATIFYHVSNACGDDERSLDITVYSLPVAGIVSGPDSVCYGNTIILSNSGASTAGTWSSAASSIASVNATGLVRGNSATPASTNIFYTVSNTCGTDVASKTVYVKRSPVTGTITGPALLCGGNTISLSGVSAGGIWSSTNTAVATVTSGGIVGAPPYASGTSTISYTVATFSCGTAAATRVVTVSPLPNPGVLTGPDSVCSGASITLTLTGAAGGGTWSATSPAIATVNNSGVVTGIATVPAFTLIQYTVVNGCGSMFSSKGIYVNPLPAAGTITGPGSMCGSTTISLAGVLPGGTWSSANPLVATVNASGIVGGGPITTAATTTISYTVATASCGTSITTHPVTVSAVAYRGYITGADTLCMLSYDTVRNHTATPGGTWRSRQGRVLFVTASSGIDTIAFQGITAGADTLVYTVSNSCGADSALFALRVNAYPLDGAVVGPASVCEGSSIILSNPTGTPGGSWTTSDPTIATVNPTTGLVVGIMAGPVVITYYGSTGCGFIPDPYSITVNPAANAVIAPTPSAVCAGSTVSLNNAGSFGIGTWISSNTAVAAVNIATGVVTGISAGTSTITYITSSTYCGLDTAFHVMTVNPLPVAGTITGTDSVCAGTAITLADLAPGGVWSSSAPGTASVSAAGVVTGGAVTSLSSVVISYTVSTPTCGTAIATHTVYVLPLPVAGTLSGPSTVCSGGIAVLGATVPGGVWSTTSPLVTVNATTGAVTGIGTGTATITYAVANSCTTAYATRNITVNTVPSMSPITGIDSVCTGATVVATSGPAGGTWTTSLGYLSVLSASGTTANIQGASAGIDTLTYTTTNVCGFTRVSRAMRVMAPPAAGFITGADTMCPGAVATLTNPSGATGGTWSHPGTILSLTSSGVVSALFAGTDTVFYTVSNFCGTVSAAHRIVINPLPVAGTIIGPPSVCVGGSVTLTNPTGTPGGFWTSGPGGTITTGGVFTGINAGPVTVSYQATTACANFFAYYTIIVNPLPTVAPISGPSTICSSTSATLTCPTTGGFWSASPTTIGTVTSSGVLNAITPGTVTVSYAVSNLCGTTTVTLPVTVNTSPFVSPLLGVATVCAGSTTTLFASTPGGVWSASNAHATVSSTGGVTGVSGGADTITYTVINACGSTSASRVVTILPVAGTDTIAGSSIICTGMITTLTTLSPGGTWSASNSHATVTGGLVTGVTAGTDTIYYMVSNTCGADTMSYVVTVNTSVTPGVTASVAPDDTLCGTAPATFTAATTNGGTAPLIRWYNASGLLATGTPMIYGPADGENIWCTLASNAVCRTNDTVVSNTLLLHQYPFIIPDVIIAASADTMVSMGQSISFTVTLNGCGSSPTYQWYINGSAIAGATSATYSTTVAGNDAYYCIATCDTPCAVSVNNHSNVITLHTGVAGISNTAAGSTAISVAPNPSNGTFMLTATGLQDKTLSYQVINAIGQVIQINNVAVNNHTVHHNITLPDVPTGQYLLRVLCGNDIQTIHIEVLK